MKLHPMTLWPVLAGTLLAGVAHAKPVAEVSVAGTIRPADSVCNVSVSNNEVQYGEVAFKPNPGGLTELSKKQLQINVGCSTAQRFAIRVVDAAQTTAVRDDALLEYAADIVLTPWGISPDAAFGLGADSTGRGIGAMFLPWHSVRFTDAENQVHDGGFVYQTDDGTWSSPGWPSVLRGRVNYAIEAYDSINAPVAVRTLSFGIDLLPVIDSRHWSRAGQLDLSGALTLEVMQI